MTGVTGNFKTTFILLVVAILCLMIYSFHHQSTYFVLSNSQGLDVNHTVVYNTPRGVQLLYHVSTKDTNQGQLTNPHNYTNVEKGLEPTGKNVTKTGDEEVEMVEELVFSPEKSVPEGSYHVGISPLSNPEQASSIGGYIAVLRVYEQQTMASGNLLQLQCWARHLNLKVVKPFMRDSNMETPLDEKRQLNMLKMGDTFDMHDWEQFTTGKGYSPLVEWEEFVKTAPRKLIVIQTRYPTITHVKAVRKKGLLFPHPPSQEKLYAEGCMFKFTTGKGMLSMQSKGFVIVRKVCLNFRTGDELSMAQLKDHILGEFRNDRVSILLDEWRGLGENQRFLLEENICKDKYSYKEQTKPSARVMRDADLYIQKYLGGSDSSYVAVMARYEMTGLTHHMNSEDDQHAIIPKCLQLTHEGLEVVKSAKHIPRVSLSTDFGKYGSVSFKRKKYFGHLPDMEEFVEKVTHMRIDDWERTFESVAHTQDSGYIAMLQLVLVTKAKCVLFVGGGTFQRHALHLYQELHPREEDRCVRVVEKCTSQYRPLV